MIELSERYFGDLEGFDEAKHNRDFFESTFVVPSSLSLESLRNNKKFIIVGRKGTGKTSVQMRLAEQVRAQSFLTHHFRFFYDLRSGDYADISKTQPSVSFANVNNQKDLFLHYDFRDVWERVFFQRIAMELVENGCDNKFTQFINPRDSYFSNIFEGITKTLSVKVTPQMGPLAAEVGFDFSKLNKKDELPLNIFNKMCRDLFKSHCNNYRMYFFVDELVFSRLDAKEDEVTIRAAMVRDIIRTIWELNSFCRTNDIEFHFICSIRPEVRNLINDLDSESGKYLDGKDVELSWTSKSTDSKNLLIDLLERKIRFSHDEPTNVDHFFAHSIRFGDKTKNLKEFLAENTWGRPRDVVRLLIAIQKKNPNAVNISESEIKAALDEYSRTSLKELVDEIGVSFGHKIIDALRNCIRKRNYKNSDEFWDALKIGGLGISKERFLKEAFELGLIGGHIPDQGKFYWCHRGESYLKPDHQIRIHAGLWNELSLR